MIHKLPPDFANHQIRIAVAGAGGNGSQVLSGLARLHLALRALGHHGLDVCVFDPDLVTPANIGRQLFSPSDLGQPKAIVLVNRINLFFGLQWQAVPSLYKPKQRRPVPRADILIGCVDTAAARRELAKSNFRYWLDLGNTATTGQVILGTRQCRPFAEILEEDLMRGRPESERPGANAQANVMAKRMKKRDYLDPRRPKLVTEIFPELLNRKLKEDNTPSCSLAEALERQDLFINQSVATFALQLLWQFIRNGGLDIHGYFINLETGRVTPLPIK